MTYTNNSLTSASPASALLAAFDPLITAVTGWSRVSSSIVVGTNTWSVYKSAAANNSLGVDFFVAFGYVTATPTILHYTMFELWNAGTSLATNFAPNSTQIPTATTWANPQAAAALPTTGTTIAYIDTAALPTTGLTYGITVLADRLIWWINGGSGVSAQQHGAYMGIFDSFLPISSAGDPMPIACVQLGPTPNPNGLSMTTAPASLPGFTTREPLQVASLSTNFGCGCNGAIASSWTLAAGGTNEIYTGKVMLSRVLLQGRQSTSYRGLLKDLYMGPTQTNAGDQITWTLNGVAHTSVRCGAVSSFGLYADQL